MAKLNNSKISKFHDACEVSFYILLKVGEVLNFCEIRQNMFLIWPKFTEFHKAMFTRLL